jgi:hypothetical protein
MALTSGLSSRNSHDEASFSNHLLGFVHIGKSSENGNTEE